LSEACGKHKCQSEKCGTWHCKGIYKCSSHFCIRPCVDIFGKDHL
ncbi:hypothetical protein LSAT2_014403, partial [Lamellibrachia satsuma]